jgi:hypothetical protein
LKEKEGLIMTRIFISYRRQDARGDAGRLADDLGEEFGEERIFRDVEDIEAGADFVEAIEEAVASANVMLVVIGPSWLESKDSSGKRRLDDPRDFVRLEIVAAFKRKVRVVPVLVGDARMPTEEELPEAIRALARRQAHELSDHRWDYDVGELVRIIRKEPVRRSESSKGAWRMALSAVLFLFGFQI